MKIIDELKKSANITFGDLYTGDFFEIVDKNYLYVKIPKLSFKDTLLAYKSFDAIPYYNCIDLSSSQLEYIDDCCEVNKLNVDIIIKSNE